MAMYVTCPYCGDNLDPGEQCSCRDKESSEEDTGNPFRIYDFEDEKAWLKGRINGIGGSDASAVIGKNPYKTNIELFEEKTGRRIAGLPTVPGAAPRIPDIAESETPVHASFAGWRTV